MKKIALSAFLLLQLMLFSGCDQLQQVVDQAANGGSSIGTNQVATGLKQALVQGARTGVKNLNQTNGFFKNAAVKVLFPPEAQKIEKTLRSIGLGSLVDDAVLKINRAAEDAAGGAKDIFVKAITKMTIQDAMGILMGEKNAATQYLQRTTTNELYASFKPVINNSLNKVGALDIWKQVVTKYNQLPTTFNKINPDLDDHVTNKAISGVFHMIEKEEGLIRANPAKRTTDIMRKVFAKQDK